MRGIHGRVQGAEELDVHSMEPDRALEWIMDKYGEEVKRFIFSYTKSATLSEDLTQEVFVNVYLKLHTYTGQSSLKTWIYSIAINKCKDYFKSWHYRKVQFMGHFQESEPITLRSTEEIVALKSESVEMIERILELPTKHREILLLFYYREFTVQEIAGIIGVSEGTVKSRLNRARNKLKDIFIMDNEVTL